MTKTSSDPDDDIIPSSTRRRPPSTAKRPATRRPPAARIASVSRQPLIVSAKRGRESPKPAVAPAPRVQWVDTHKLVGVYLSAELRTRMDEEIAQGGVSKSRIVETELRKRYGMPPPPRGPRDHGE
jgi:hypothetical protein